MKGKIINRKILKRKTGLIRILTALAAAVLLNTPEMMATLLLPAGVTSPASILYKDEAELLKNSSNPDETYINKILPQKMKYNLEYIKKFGLIYDIKIMIKTVFAVIKR